MTYYRVKKEYDGKRVRNFHELVRNELYTEKELEKHGIPMQCVVEVSEKRKDVYWFFGARFGTLGYND